MGLDICYYGGLHKLSSQPTDQAAIERLLDRRDVVHIYSNESFPGRAEPLEQGAFYTFDFEGEGFRAGSYSGYGNWRRQLAKLAGYQSPEAVWDSISITSGPFYELINFSDCEGTIGPAVSAKLAADFAEFQSAADKSVDDGDWDPKYFVSLYNNWRKAFETAADNGAVCFH